MFVTRGGGCGTNFRSNSVAANSNTAVRSLGMCASCGVTNFEQRPVRAQEGLARAEGLPGRLVPLTGQVAAL
jgi:hypothetical protein